MCLRMLPSYVVLVLVATSTTSVSHLSTSWLTVADVRGWRCSSTWFCNRGECLLGLIVRTRPGRDRFGEVAVSLGEWSRAG